MSRRTFVKIEIAFLLIIPTWFGVLNCAGITPDSFSIVFLLAYYYLVIGWAYFLTRVLPHVVIDWFHFGLAAVCLTAFVGGLHFFCSWLYREINLKKAARDHAPASEPTAMGVWKFRTTLSIVGILMLMFVAGVSAVGAVHQLVWLRTRP